MYICVCIAKALHAEPATLALYHCVRQSFFMMTSVFGFVWALLLCSTLLCCAVRCSAFCAGCGIGLRLSQQQTECSRLFCFLGFVY